MQTKSFPTLYKTTSTGKEQQWDIFVETDSGPGATVVTKYGQVDGKIQTAKYRVEQGKNIGRANETTPWEQACSEADSKWLKQKDKGYSEERGGASMVYKPMLAHKYENHFKKVKFPAFLQPKLDGVRCIAIRKPDEVVLLSRNSKKHIGLDHIRNDLFLLMEEGEIWDGELYNHELDFQKIISLVKKDQPESCLVQYHVYDVIRDDPFEWRYWQAAVRIENTYGVDSVTSVSTLTVKNHEDISEFLCKYISLGYEGVMVRHGDCTYKQGYRSRELLKVKTWQTGEFEIIDVICGKGKMEDQGIFICNSGRGGTFRAVPEGTSAEREHYLTNRESLIGKMLTVRYFDWTTSDVPEPRFPTALAIRDYE